MHFLRKAGDNNVYGAWVQCCRRDGMPDNRFPAWTAHSHTHKLPCSLQRKISHADHTPNGFCAFRFKRLCDLWPTFVGKGTNFSSNIVHFRCFVWTLTRFGMKTSHNINVIVKLSQVLAQLTNRPCWLLITSIIQVKTRHLLPANILTLILADATSHLWISWRAHVNALTSARVLSHDRTII